MTEQDLLDFIKQHAPEPRKPRPDGFGVTIKEYAAHEGISEDAARKVLSELVAAGLLEMHPMVSGRAAPNVYARPNAWKKVV